MPHHSSDTVARATADGRWFATTHWSAIASIRLDGDSPQATRALEELCGTYRPAVYSYLKWRCANPEEAEDLTQAFFVKVLAKDLFAKADSTKGRLRNFLLTVLRQFLADHRDGERAQKRGGGVPLLSLDEHSGGDVPVEEHDRSANADLQFDRQWAASVMQRAQKKLLLECAASGKAGLLDRISLLDDEREKTPGYAEVAKQLGMSLSAVKSAVKRMRCRYGELVRDEIAQTVSSPADLEEEIRHLLKVFCG